MANEAVIIELLGNGGTPVRYTVGNNNGISKGVLLGMVDPRGVSASTTTIDAFAGVAAMDKSAGDGSTTIAAYTHGIFDLTTTSVAVTAGSRVKLISANMVSTCLEADLLSATVGIALETSGADEVIAVLVGSGF